MGLQGWVEQIRHQGLSGAVSNILFVISAIVLRSKGNMAIKPSHYMRKSWESLLKVAKISNFIWHDMRHDYASQLVMSGVDLNTVRELLGHADLKMTLRYAHLASEHKQKAIRSLQNRRSEMLNHRKESDA